jgi:hypothetical protein
MKTKMLVVIVALLCSIPAVATDLPVAPNGIPYFKGYRVWPAIAPSARPDKDHIRLIFGNDIAMDALRRGIRPVPDGAILAKAAWTTKKHPQFPVAVVPDKFVQVEFMVKDKVKYQATGGWGFARFVGDKLQPYGKDAGFVQECFGCHTPVKDNDFVFTHWPPVP